MGFILNASIEEQHVKVFGNHFTLKAGQIKQFEDKISHFMAIDKAYYGLAALPEEFADPEYKNTPEGKAVLEEARKKGVEARCNFLRQIIFNNEVSLRQDLDRANMKVDPKAMASDGEIKAYEELIKYQKKSEDEAAKKASHIAELQKQLKD